MKEYVERQAVIDTIKAWYVNHEGKDDLISEIKKIPSERIDKNGGEKKQKKTGSESDSK
jgi:hypothetical protein